MKKYLIINTGSVSAKYSIYSQDAELFFGHFEIEVGKAIVTFFNGGRTVAGITKPITDAIFQDSLAYFIDEAMSQKIIESKEDIFAIAVRVVAPGTYFQSDHLVDEKFLSDINKEKEEAPLHVTVTLAEITELKKIFPSTSIIGISDSAFHKDTQDSVHYYAIPKKVAKELDIYHFGYHGISVGSIVNKVSKERGLPGKVIVCHLGGGSSVTAVKDGKSFDTSMGYTPLEGLVTSTRAGNIDPVAILHLGKKLNKSIAEMEAYFNEECGLLGLSGISSDIRDLLVAEKDGNTDATLALSKFIFSVKRYIGAYIAEMGGIDMLIFSGTIGERSFVIRERICSGLESMGIVIDRAINNTSEGIDQEIGANGSRVRVLVVCTDEMADMAERVREFKI
jgi:acetate kinase